MSENSNLEDSMPDLELFDHVPDAPMVDRRCLTIGDPLRVFDESLLEDALKLRKEALKI